MAKLNFLKHATIITLLAISGWAIFSLVQGLFVNLANKIGVINPIYISMMIIVIVAIILTILKVSWKKMFK